MRLIAVLAALPLIGAAPPAQPVQVPGLKTPLLDSQRTAAGCPDTPMSLARDRNGPLMHRKLVDLPPAQAFAAVDRRVAGCPAPMLLGEGRR